MLERKKMSHVRATYSICVLACFLNKGLAERRKKRMETRGAWLPAEGFAGKTGNKNAGIR
jgi:hypothetical protein